MKPAADTPLTAPVALLIALATAALTAWLLSVVAAPSGLNARLKAAQSELGPSGAAPAAAARYPAGAICQSPLVPASQAVQKSLASKLANAGLTVGELSVSAGTAGAGPDVGLLNVALEASGDYASSLAFLESVEASRPQLYIDAIDIQPADSTLTLKLSGQVYCWISVHP